MSKLVAIPIIVGAAIWMAPLPKSVVTLDVSGPAIALASAQGDRLLLEETGWLTLPASFEVAGATLDATRQVLLWSRTRNEVLLALGRTWQRLRPDIDVRPISVGHKSDSGTFEVVDGLSRSLLRFNSQGSLLMRTALPDHIDPVAAVEVGDGWAILGRHASDAVLGQTPERPEQCSLNLEQVYSTTGPRDSLLAYVSMMAISHQGEVYVMDEDPPRVFVYGQSGQLVRQFGGEGDGPGEFRFPRAMGFLSDTLWVSDAIHRRTTLFDSNGTVVATIPVSGVGSSGVIPSALLGDGSALGSRPGEVGTEKPDFHALRWPILELTREGIVTDTLVIMRPGHPVLFVGLGAVFGYQPLNDGDRWVPIPGGGGSILVDRTASSRDSDATFEVRWFGEHGETTSVHRFPYVPVPVSKSLREGIENEAVSRIVENMRLSVAEARNAAREGLFIPKNHPPVTRVLVDRDRRVWLRREDTGDGDLTWDIVTSEGTKRCSVQVPRNLRLHAVDGEYVWGSVIDSLGLFELGRYQVELTTVSG